MNDVMRFLANGYQLGAIGFTAYCVARVSFGLGARLADWMFGGKMRQLQAKVDALEAAKWQQLANSSFGADLDPIELDDYAAYLENSPESRYYSGK